MHSMPFSDDTLSNVLNVDIWPDHYRFDPAKAIGISTIMDSLDLPKMEVPITEIMVKYRRRNQQTPALLGRLYHSLGECRHKPWLEKRRVSSDNIFSIDYGMLNRQDQLDLQLMPSDYILDRFGEEPVDGPTFLDMREGRLAGVCVRNVSTNLEYAAAAKYTFSNCGWFLFGYDDYRPTDKITLVEGVFDALALRAAGAKAIALGSARPTVFQLACLLNKYSKFATCFDNDMWGRIGAYITAKTVHAEVYTPRLKDVACYHETGQRIQVDKVPLSELREHVSQEIIEFNRTGLRQKRDLPYNQQ